MAKTDTAWGCVHSDGGTLGTWNHRPVVRTDDVSDRFVLYGPYIDLAPGRYAVAFVVHMVDAPEINDEELGVVDVFRSGIGDVVASASVTLRKLSENAGRIILPFSMDTSARVEFRVFIKGSVPLVVEQDRDLYAEQQCFTWMQARPSHDVDELSWMYDGYLVRNFDNLKQFSRHGVRVVAAEGGAELDKEGVKIKVKNGEDLQVFTEIFIYNGYAFAAQRDVICIDIGMNVGMASLFFASSPRVVEVHSFEPFQSPYDRALYNFSLNPALSAKITANNSGLGYETEDLSVQYDPAETISVSVGGSASANAASASIKVVSAAEALGPLIQGAKKRGIGVVLKVDCEGSEFGIVKSLREADLLRDCDVVMMEWHKWFSKDLNERDLIDPLTESGHVVFDRTRITDEGTGLLFSVRAPAPERSKWQFWKAAPRRRQEFSDAARRVARPKEEASA